MAVYRCYPYLAFATMLTTGTPSDIPVWHNGRLTMNELLTNDTSHSSPVDPEAVRIETGWILEHPSFRQSERCSKLLRFLVEASLRTSEPLKERTIGQEVFGRPVGYDTYSDPVVRNAASDLRKRLKQYYHESPANHKVRMDLPNGRYLLHIEAADEFRAEEPVEPATADSHGSEHVRIAGRMGTASNEQSSAGRNLYLLYAAAAVAICIISLVAAGLLVYRSHQQPRNAFWDSALAPGGEVVVSVGTHKEEGADPQKYFIPLPSVSAYGRIAALLDRHQRAFVMKPDTQTTMDDLRGGTAILIGRRTNIWTARLSSSLRFQYGEDAAKKTAYFVDTSHPNLRWEVSEADDSEIDYAMVARIASPITGGTVILLSGLGPNGTSAAAEFLTDPRYAALLNRTLSPTHENLQVILKAPVIGGSSGSPEVVAVHTW
jgi:hypothetical protein